MQTAPHILYRRLAGLAGIISAACCVVGCARLPVASNTDPGQSRFPAARWAERQKVLDKAVQDAEERRSEAYARFAAGLVHDLKDQDAEALANFEKSIQADPSQESLVLDVARRHLMRKETDKAIEVLRQAIQPGSSGILSALLASVYISAGRTNEAMAANLQAIERSPTLLIGYHNLANLHVLQGRPQDGIQVLERATRVPNPPAQFLVELAELWLGFPQAGAETAELTRRRAGEMLDRAVPRMEGQSLLRQRAADAYMLIGQNSKAIDIYLKLLEQYPQATPIRERLADLFLQSRDSKRAIEQMEALIKEEPSRYPQAYLILGNLSLQEGKFKEAEDHLRKALVLSPKNEPVYYDLAVAQINGGSLREGLETLNDARHRFKETFQSEFFSGIAHARLKEYSNSVARFTTAEIIARARETNRLTHFFYFQLGSAHERNKNLAEAENYFRKAIALHPDFGEALNYLGYMWVEAGIKLAEAHAMIERAVKLEPKNPAFLDSLAWAHFKLGNPKEAMVWMKKCIEHATEPDPTLYDHLGDIHAALGEKAQAVESWNKALKIEPNPDIEKKLRESGQTAVPPAPDNAPP